MRYRNILIWTLLVLIALSGCRPKGLLTSRQMRKVLYDLHRADAILQVEGLTYGHDEDVAKYYQVVLDKHHITKAEFDSSLVWYTDHPQLFNKIYPKVMNRVMDEKAQWEALDQVGKTVKRQLRPIDEICDELQLGYPIDLWQVPDDSAEVRLGPVYKVIQSDTTRIQTKAAARTDTVSSAKVSDLDETGDEKGNVLYRFGDYKERIMRSRKMLDRRFLKDSVTRK